MLFLVSSFLISENALAVNSSSAKVVQPQVGLADMQAFGVNSVEDFLALTPKKFREATGKKLSIKETIGLKVAQKKVKKAVVATGASAAAVDASRGKSQIVALILVIFLGGLGIHRFYLGYTTIGIIQLLTAGGCGIWALIDLIRIATGDLKPKDGEYAEKL